MVENRNVTVAIMNIHLFGNTLFTCSKDFTMRKITFKEPGINQSLEEASFSDEKEEDDGEAENSSEEEQEDNLNPRRGQLATLLQRLQGLY